MRKRPILLVSALALGLLVAACAPAAAPPAPAGEQPAAGKEAAPAAKKGLTPADALGPKYGGTLNIWAYDWPHLDPHQTLTAGMHGVVGLVYGTLLRFETGPDVTSLKIAPSMAESWEQPDTKTYIFKLRKGIKWHNIPPVNGREFTADDVVYSVKRISTPGWISAPLMADVEKVEALDRYTVKFTLKGPSAPFLPYLANAYIKMVAQEAVEAGEGGELKKGPTVGTGPFYGEKDDIKAKVGVTLRKHPDYWEKDPQGNQLPYLDGIQGINIPDTATQFAALRTGRLDLFRCTTQDCEILKKASPEVAIVEVKSWSAGQYGLKVNKPPFNDVRVRKAVSLAFDRKTFMETLSPGVRAEEGWYHLSFTMPDEGWVLPQEAFEKAWKYDPEEAKKLLAEAGHPNGFEAPFTCANYGAASITSCEFIMDGLKKVGIKTKMKIVDPPTYSSHVFAGAGDFEMYYGPQGVFLEPDQWLSAYYRTGGPRNVNGINDPKLDALIDAQRVEVDLNKRKAILQEVQRYLLGQYYHLHTRAGVGQTAIWPWVGNYSPMSDYPTQRGTWYQWLNQDLKKQYGK